MTGIIPITSQERWHTVRASHIGGSDIASLFDASPYMTRFELWHIKKGSMPDAMEESDRMFWGKMLEAGIARGLAQQQNWTIQPPSGYYVHSRVKGMGCTPDFFIDPVEGFTGRGVLQIKNISYLEWLDSWQDQEPPLHYLLQLQHELACTGCSWGAIGILVGGNESYAFPYLRHDGTVKRIEQTVREFWLSIERNEEPKAVSEDYSVVRRLYRRTSGETIDLSKDNELPWLCSQALQSKDARLAAEKDEHAFKAEIIRKMRGAEVATCQGFRIEFPEYSQSITETEAHTRNYRKLTIKENAHV
jgi:putative phage-type endonuclease